MSPNIRAFQSSDLDRVLDIAVAAWEPIVKSSRELVGAELFDLAYPDPAGRKRDQVSQACAEESTTLIWVAEVDHEIVGFITVELDMVRRVGQIGNNAVDPAQQGSGIGESMYRFVLSRMKDAGMESAVVVTGLDEAHAPARRAYEKVGFSGGVPSVMFHLKIK